MPIRYFFIKEIYKRKTFESRPFDSLPVVIWSINNLLLFVFPYYSYELELWERSTKKSWSQFSGFTELLKIFSKDYLPNVAGIAYICGFRSVMKKIPYLQHERAPQMRLVYISDLRVKRVIETLHRVVIIKAPNSNRWRTSYGWYILLNVSIYAMWTRGK